MEQESTIGGRRKLEEARCVKCEGREGSDYWKCNRSGFNTKTIRVKEHMPRLKKKDKVT